MADELKLYKLLREVALRQDLEESAEQSGDPHYTKVRIDGAALRPAIDGDMGGDSDEDFDPAGFWVIEAILYSPEKGVELFRRLLFLGVPHEDRDRAVEKMISALEASQREASGG